MKKLTTTNSFLFLISFLPLFLLQSCVVVRNTHNDAVDIGYFKDKGEGQATISADFNDETSGLNGGYLYSPVNNVIVGGGISAFTYKLFDDNIGPADGDNNRYYEDNGDLSGFKIRANAGYYVHYGSKRPGFAEVLITLAYGKNSLDVAEDEDKINYLHYDYNPFSAGIQFGVGTIVNKVGLMGGIKLQRYYFNEKIPVFHEDYQYYKANGISIVQPFLDMRFGAGPLKGNFQFSFCINPKDYGYSYAEPLINFSFGTTYTFGRKVKEEVTF